MATEHVPSQVVVVARAVCAVWCGQPWADVVAAAEAGTDGLRFAVDAERLAHRPADDTAHLREGDGTYGRNKTLLYKQGW